MKSNARSIRIILFHIFSCTLLTTADGQSSSSKPTIKTIISQNASTLKFEPSSSSSTTHPQHQQKGTVTSVQSDPPKSTIKSDFFVESGAVENVVQGTFKEKNHEDGVFTKSVFVETTSQNSGVANDITIGPPVVVTLTDAATAELQERAAIIPPPSQQEDKLSANQSTDSNETRSGSPTEDTSNSESTTTKGNLTEDIPSFSEWTQQRLEEAEKQKDPPNASTQPQNTNGKQGSGAKLRWKNYASLDCGAKVVASNPEAVSPYAVLSPSRDEYKLNTCTSRIWFIVELCEAIQAKKIDLANFELFSSSPKDFTVSVSDRFPTREWSNVGQFTAKDERDVQNFDLHPHLFGKYIKVEIKSHYGAEHFCPISLFRVYGTSEFEVLQKEDPVNGERDDDDDDDDESLDIDTGDSSKNLFSSATDAVISMVKKAAQVLGNKGLNESRSVVGNVTKSKYTPLVNSCTSPSHLVVCDNCSDTLFGLVYQLLSCKSNQIRNLVAIPLIRKALIRSHLCRSYGFDFRRIAANCSENSRSLCVESFFPAHYLGAMCNSLAIAENKVVLNISNQYSNTTDVVGHLKDNLKIVRIETSEPRIVSNEQSKDVEITDALKNIELTSSIETSTNIAYTSQIKPTKTMTSESNLHESTESPLVVVDVLDIEESATQEPLDSVSEAVPFPPPPTQEVLDQELEAPPTESVEALDLDHIMSELNGDASTAKDMPVTTTPQVQKESVFLRLSNRIKALERNMSLSGQYLEELSKRYKKQVEEMQKLLERTVVNMDEEIRRQDERNKNLEDALKMLQAIVDNLIAERNGWSSTVYCIVTSTLVTLFVYRFCLQNANKRIFPPSLTSSLAQGGAVEVKRRQSIDVVNHQETKKKKRRPSDQALKIVRSSMTTKSDDAVSDCVRNKDPNKKKKKRKDKMKRSNSISTLNEEAFKPPETSSKIWNRDRTIEDWIDVNNGHLEDVPFALDESEHSTLEQLCTVVPMKTNGTTPSPVAGDVPSYVSTALKSRKDREFGAKLIRKSASGDEVGSKRQSPIPSLNGNLAVNNGNEDRNTPKKEKRSFKKMFKKVF